MTTETIRMTTEQHDAIYTWTGEYAEAQRDRAIDRLRSTATARIAAGVSVVRIVNLHGETWDEYLDEAEAARQESLVP